MTHYRWMTRCVLRIYPAAWRRQYGDELVALLERQPFTAGLIVDVARAALWQRVRGLTPGTMIGLACVVLFFVGVAVTPTGYASAGVSAIIQPSGITFPTIKVTFFESEFFAVLLIACGWWTQIRRGYGAARAAAWMTIVAGLPVMIAGLMMWGDLASVHMALPGMTGPLVAPHALNMAIAPLLRAPESAIWGAVGGRLGRWVSRRRR
jgi:hypothetical protein